MIRDRGYAADCTNECSGDEIHGFEVLDQDDLLSPVESGALRLGRMRGEDTGTMYAQALEAGQVPYRDDKTLPNEEHAALYCKNAERLTGVKLD